MKAKVKYEERRSHGCVILTPENSADEEALRAILMNGRMSRCSFQYGYNNPDVTLHFQEPGSGD